jgi:hypothetical protein
MMSHLWGALPLFDMDVFSLDWQAQGTIRGLVCVPEVEELQLLLKTFQLNQN